MPLISGDYIKDKIIKNEIDESFVGDNFVKLTVENVYRHSKSGVITEEDWYRTDKKEIPTHTRREFDQRGRQNADSLLRQYGIDPRDRESRFYWLRNDLTYLVEFQEDLDIEEGQIGFVFPRQGLLNVGATLETSVLTSDTEKLTALLIVDTELLICEDAVLGHLVVLEN